MIPRRAVGDTELTASNNNWARYWRIVVLVGVAMNLVVGIPALFIPGTILDWIGLPFEVTEFWVRLACWLLILLSLTYIPTAIDPYRSPAHSWLTVGARWGGVFFVTITVVAQDLSLGYLYFALGDLIFAIPELIILNMVFKNKSDITAS